MEHVERRRWCQQISRINETVNGDANEKSLRLGA